jgi:hypothetical protein
MLSRAEDLARNATSSLLLACWTGKQTTGQGATTPDRPLVGAELARAAVARSLTRTEARCSDTRAFLWSAAVLARRCSVDTPRGVNCLADNGTVRAKRRQCAIGAGRAAGIALQARSTTVPLSRQRQAAVDAIPVDESVVERRGVVGHESLRSRSTAASSVCCFLQKAKRT